MNNLKLDELICNPQLAQHEKSANDEKSTDNAHSSCHEKAVNERKYPQRTPLLPVRLGKNPLPQTRCCDNPTMKQAYNEK